MDIWLHQREAVEWLMGRPNGILHHGMGAGKTRSVLEFLRALNHPRRVLVCCPKAVIPAWQKQVGLWLPQYQVVALDQSSRQRKEKALRAAFAYTCPLIVVCNYDSAWRIPAIEKAGWDVLVWDEVHRLKSPSGRASRWAARMATKNPDARKVGLTGTLIPHSILDVQPIYRAVESPDCPTFGTSQVLHKTKYAVINPHVRGMVVGWKNLPDAHRRIAETTHHVKSCDVLDLPPITYLDEQIPLSPAEASLYSEIEGDFCAVCQDGSVTPQNALEQLLRLQQLCGGFIRYDGKDSAEQVCAQPAKQQRIADMLGDLPSDEPVVIFCRFRSDIDSAVAACLSAKRTTSELSGRRNDLAAWQDGETSSLIAQIQSGGIGIDLTRASYAFFYSLGYSLAEYEQAVARLHRPGQQRRTLIYHLIATNGGRQTVDGRVYQCLKERKEVVNGIIDGYRRAAPSGAR